MIKPNTTPVPESLFTDREGPVNAFWDNLYELGKDPEGKTRIVTYYGEGGIGKTWLLNKLRSEINSNKKDLLQRKYVSAQFDLEDSHYIVDILCSFRAQIGRQTGFAFPIFDTAIRRMEEIKTTELRFHTPAGAQGTAKSLLDLTGGILKAASMTMNPAAVGLCTLYEFFRSCHDTGFAGKKLTAELFRHFDSDTREWTEDVLKRNDAADLAANFPNYFYADLSRENRDFSIIFFIDTFEKLEQGNSFEKIKYSLTREIPGYTSRSLWVFSGRNAIYHADRTPEGLPVDEHLIGDLSEADSIVYLRDRRGITDEKIVEKIYDITGGTPVFLDIAVASYKQQGYPSADDFDIDNKETLVQRYTKYLNGKEKHILRAMSSMMHWTDEDFIYVFEKVYGLQKFEYYRPGYSRLIRSTMIELLDEERRFLHRSVRSAVYDDKDFPEETRKMFLDQMLLLYQERVSDDKRNQLYYKDRIIELLERLIKTDEKDRMTAENHRILRDLILDSSQNYRSYGISFIDEYIDVLERFIRKGYETESSIYGDALILLHLDAGRDEGYCEVMQEVHEEESEQLGEDALHEQEDALEYYRKQWGEDHPLTVMAKHQLADTYLVLNMYQDACPLQEELLEQYRKEYGENYLDTSYMKNNLALTYEYLGKRKDALRLREEVFGQLKELLGRDHPNTISAKRDLTDLYRNMGMNEEAGELEKDR